MVPTVLKEAPDQNHSMIKRIKELLKSKYFRIFIAGILVHGLCSFLFDAYHDSKLGSKIIREDYTYAEFVFWLGQILQDLIWLPLFYKLFESIYLGKYAVRFYMDLVIVDLGYLILSNPYHFNRAKLEYIEITCAFFVLHTSLMAIKKPEWIKKFHIK